LQEEEEFSVKEITDNVASNRGASVLDSWEISAGEYDAYASQTNLYRDSAEALVRLAEIEPGMVVVDLACGTGIVTETILKQRFADKIRVMSVDYSAEMLARAQKRIQSPNVEFHQGTAETLSQTVRNKVDRVLCNAAFWHFDKTRTLSEISRILKPDGKCLLGLPVQDYKLVDFLRLYDENRVVWMIMEEKLLRGHGSKKPADNEEANKRRAAYARDKNDVVGYLSDSGLSLDEVETISIDVSPKDYIDFLRIPVMASKSFLFKGLSHDEITGILDVVTNELEWVECSVPASVWLIYTLSKTRARE
jgi:ubiquinone/menaquinone biosynthesis C-methylase UbiE